MTVTLALLEDELTLYCIDGGLAVSADFHIGQGSQTQGRDPDLGRERILWWIVISVFFSLSRGLILFRKNGFDEVEKAFVDFILNFVF